MTILHLSLRELLDHAFGQQLPSELNLSQLPASAQTMQVELDVHELLARDQVIGVFWCVEDVQSCRPDLDEDQCWQVLRQVRRYHDCNDGINWDMLDTVAEILFGPAEE